MREVTSETTSKPLLPGKSKKKYEKEFKIFNTWCESNNVLIATENVMLGYFELMSKTKKASTLWASYSMLRSCLILYKNIDISKYSKLTSFLKRKSRDYEPKKSKILEIDDINKFINTADDYTFLAIKVVAHVFNKFHCI